MKAAISIFRFAVLPVIIHVSAAAPRAHLPTSHPSGLQQVKSRDTFGSTDTETSASSAGAFQTNTCSHLPDDYIWQVQAQWIIPNIYRPPSLSGPGRWWVFHELAIDGLVAGCDAQAAYGGLSMNVAVDDAGVSRVVVQGFYQYYPDPVQFFDVDFAVGDHVQMTINSFGWPPTYTIFNLSANKSDVRSPSTSQPAICNRNGGFLVSDPMSNGVESPLAAFDDFEMSEIIFTYYANDCNLDGATLINMVRDKQAVVSASSEDSQTLLFQQHL